MQLPLLVVVALQAIVLLAFVAQAATGFGATVLMVALSALVVPLQIVLPAFVPVNTLLSGYTSLRRAKEIRFRILFVEMVPAMAVGLALGMLTFRKQAHEGIKLAFAILVGVLALVELWRLRRASMAETVQPPLRPLLRNLLLFLGGYIHGVFGSGGPMIVYVLRRRIPDKGAMRATLALVWFTLNVPLIVNYTSLGLIGWRSITLSLLLAVPFWPAVVLGDWVHRRLDGRRFQIMICLLLLVAGIALATRTALSMLRTS